MWTWTFLFSPYGRISRKTYWLNWILPYLVISIFVTVLDYAFFPIDPAKGEPPPVFQSLIGLFFLWPSIATTIKRLHDRGMTGWWNLAAILAAIPIAFAAYWYDTTQKMAEYGFTPATAPTVFSPAMGAAIVVFSIVGIGVMIYLVVNTLLLRGQNGDNKYGADPLGVNQAEVFS